MNYDEIKNKILETLNNEDIIYDGDFISAYDLIQAIDKELGKIKFLINNKDLFKLMVKFPKCKKNKNNLSYIDFGYEKVYFVFKNELSDNLSFLSVSKDINGNLVDNNHNIDDTLENDFKNKFIELNKDLINNIIKAMEDLKKKYNININYGDNKIILPFELLVSDDNFYRIYETNYKYFDRYQILLWNGDDNINYHKGLMDDFKNNIDNAYDILGENNSLLLKKIPVKISNLNPLYQNIINMCYNKNEKVLRKNR